MSDLPRTRVAPLALYEGDLLNRLFGRLGFNLRKPLHLIGRSLVVLALTWIPMATIAVFEGLYSAEINARNFFADFAAYAIFFIGLPLFIVAEAIVSRGTAEAAGEFATSGVLRSARKLAALERLHLKVGTLRDSLLGEAICVICAYFQSSAIILTELFRHGPVETWHTDFVNGQWDITATGLWAFGVAIPIAVYWWVRHVWRIALWCYYLYGVSRLRLDLIATHPDRTGGIGFISEVQGHWAWVIFAFGVTNVAAPVGYQIALLQVDLWTLPVWGSIVGFVIGAPLLFTAPLFLFTRQLAINKLLARRRYRKLLMEHTRTLEGRFLPKNLRHPQGPPVAGDVAIVTQLSQLFDRVQGMRVVPFDFRSMSQLASSTLGSVVIILPILKLEGPATRVLEALVKILGSFK